MNNMMTRIAVGAIGIPLMIVAMGAGGWAFSLVVMGMTTAALWEFYHLCSSKHAEANRAVGIAWSVVFQATLATAVHDGAWWSPSWLLLLGGILTVGTVATLAAELWRNIPNALLNTAMTAMGLLYVTLGFSALLLLRHLPVALTGVPASTMADLPVPMPQGFAVVLLTFLSVWICDSAAYFAGMAFGRHKLFPRVSPKKSWEGALVGGVASAAAFTLLGQRWLPFLPLAHAIGAGILIAVVGQVGDLAESLLKRDAAIKDSSQLIPGHGGFLDRFDSMLFVAPVLLVYFLLSQSTSWLQAGR